MSKDVTYIQSTPAPPPDILERGDIVEVKLEVRSFRTTGYLYVPAMIVDQIGNDVSVQFLHEEFNRVVRQDQVRREW